MLIRIILLLSTILLYAIQLFSQQRWEITLGRPDISEVVIDNIETYDKGCCLLNYEEWGKIYLIKTDVNGMELWTKTLINPETYISPQSMYETQTGEIIITGGTGAAGLILKLDPCGEIIWCTQFGNHNYNLVSFNDAVVLDNGDILVLAFMQRVDGSIMEQNFLFCFDNNGNLLWKKPYASKYDYPLFGDRVLWELYHFPNYFLMVGEGYYPYPDDGSQVFIRPLFVRVDSAFNEVFVLPYGVEDSIVGNAHAVKHPDKGLVNTAVGAISVPNLSDINTLVMKFDEFGDETAFWFIPNEEIGAEVKTNSGLDIIQATDSTEIIKEFLKVNELGYPAGEILVDSTYSVLSSFIHENTAPATPDITYSYDSLFLFATTLKEVPDPSSRDILLYKLNADLSQADFDSNTYVYDSLCDDLPIVSDTIYLDNCSIITGLDEIREPQDYYAYIKTIPVHIFPNPATSGVTFELGNTEHHKNIRLSCFDINGKLVFEQPLANDQSQIRIKVSGWQSGMYIAIASSSNGGTGSAKFLIR